MKRILALILYALATIYQSYSRDIPFKTLSSVEGYHQTSVRCLYSDRWGEIWIGGRDGLYSYNGKRVKQYSYRTSSLSGEMQVKSLTGDGKNKIYILSMSSLVEYDQSRATFKTLLEGDVNAVYCNQEGLYVLSKKNLILYKAEDMSVIKEYSIPTKGTYGLFSIYVDRQDRIWIGCPDGLFVKSKSDSDFEKFLDSSSGISSVYEEPQGNNIWVGTIDEGCYLLSSDGNVTNISGGRFDISFVRCFVQEDSSNILLGTKNGLFRYSMQDGSIARINGTKNTSGAEITPSIWCMLKDRQGVIWMGTWFSGIFFYNPAEEIYTFYDDVFQANGMEYPVVVGDMEADKNGRLWVGTEGNGVVILDNDGSPFRPASIAKENVKCLKYDSARDWMWVGTHRGGLFCLEASSGRLVASYRHDKSSPVSLPSDIVRDIAIKGDIIVLALENAGFSILDIRTGRCESPFQQTYSNSVCFDSDGNLWVSAGMDGVRRYDFTSGQVSNYSHIPDVSGTLSSNSVQKIFLDSKDRLWFTTFGGGVNLYLPQSDEFQIFDSSNGDLLEDNVYAICQSPGSENNIFLLTSSGLTILDLTDKHSTSYLAFGKGLPMFSANDNALYVSPDCKVFVGGIDRLISFNLDDVIRLETPSSRLQFASLYVNGNEVTPADATDILDCSLPYAEGIVLGQSAKSLTIEIASFDYSSNNSRILQYCMEGISSEWFNFLPNQTSVSFSGLNPGRYVLKVRYEGLPYSVISLNIRVKPVWYLSVWAIVVYFLLLIVIIVSSALIYRARVKLRERLKYEHQRAEDIQASNQSKLQFFTNLSHEFRSLITLIIGSLENVLRGSELSPALYKRLLSIYHNGNRLKGLLSELLDFRKQELGYMKLKVQEVNLVDFVNESVMIYKEYASDNSVSIDFVPELNKVNVFIDTKQMSKVFNNLISNALKHTKAGGSIIVGLNADDSCSYITVTDTGDGISEMDLTRIFDSYYQAEQFNSYDTGTGTGLGLALSKGIVEMHKGTISVESKVGRGSKFIVRLLLGSAHYSQDEFAQDPQPLFIGAPLPSSLSKETESSQVELDAAILIVENNLSIRELLVDIFSPYYNIRTASDGQEALSVIKSSDNMPDLVLSDVLMSPMSGMELCKHLKNDPMTCHIPVVLLTALTSVEHNLEGLKLGADDYISKPFNTEILLSRCNNLVNSRRMLKEKYGKIPQSSHKMLATNPMDKSLLDKLVSLVEDNLSNPLFGVDQFAKQMGFGRTVFYAKIKSLTGQSPNEFILNIKLKAAAAMLLEKPEMNVNEVSEATGFSSAQYFCKCFKDFYRQSPLSYRKSNTVGSVYTMHSS
ncbi:MAG: two-component regulator propeller domain-containing protein [Candidatus Cryptobacteroides sp.]